MIVIFTVSITIAAMLALTAFLQAEAAWWKGPTASIVLVVIGVLAAFVIPSQNSSGPRILEATPTAILWFCAVLMIVGSILGLALRPFLSSGKIAKLVFVSGLMVIFAWLFIGGLLSNG